MLPLSPFFGGFFLNGGFSGSNVSFGESKFRVWVYFDFSFFILIILFFFCSHLDHTFTPSG